MLFDRACTGLPVALPIAVALAAASGAGRCHVRIIHRAQVGMTRTMFAAQASGAQTLNPAPSI